MKIRIKGPSVRLRLTQTEVRTFASTGVCVETTPLPGGLFRYALRTGTDFQAHFDGSELAVFVPQELAEHWANSEEVGMSHVIQLAGGGEVKLLVEKDFACLDPNRDEDESDMFPNPNPHC